MRPILIVLACALLVACAVRPDTADLPRAASPANALTTPADGYLQEPTRIDPRITVFASPQPFHVQPIGNVAAIEQSDGFVLVDAGGTPAAAERIIAMLSGVSDKPVKAIVITHWHGDHVLGLRTMLARWPDARTISTAPTRAHLSDPATARFMPTGDEENDRAILQNLEAGVAFLQERAADTQFQDRIRAGYAQAAREVAQHAYDLADADAARMAPMETFTDRLVIPDRDAPVEVLFLGRANTDGDAVVWTPRQRVLITGDIVVAPIPFGFGAYPEQWIETLGRLKMFDFAMLVPGHGAVMRDSAYVDSLIALLTAVRAHVGPLARTAPLETVREQVSFAAEADAFSGGDPWLRRWFQPYWAAPIVASAYKEARGEPIVQGEP
ncbi:MAG: MBL fold metallo-hydrolase [Alphaproteobacteria bacterium]|nr:MBL fold metallo-hydrolase [Alphaproteobacteria bacterium]